MPAPGSQLKNGPRHNILDKTFHAKFMEETGIEIPYELFVDIINASNDKITSKVINNAQGFKLPSAMGYVVVTRYKPKPNKDGTPKRFIDWAASKKAGVTVYHTNFHSYGYKPRIMWLTDQLSSVKFVNIYKLVPSRELERGVSHQMKAGKIYNEYNYEHFKTRRIKINLNKFN